MNANEHDNSLKILVVEDDKLLAHLAALLLKKVGCIATVSNNGKDALDKWTKEEDFIVAFIDLGLPDMRGFSLIKEMKKLKPNIPLVILTARLEFEEEKEILCKKLGVDAFLFKPLDAPKVIDTIAKVTNRQLILIND